MGMLLGVGRGSADPPRLVAIRYEPAAAPKAPVLGLVGKGITFDTGGISIKPATDMDRMKDDMSGGSAVTCAMCAMAELGAPIRAVGVIPIAENMPGGSALRPGDVLTSASGKTVEVINTDCGRTADSRRCLVVRAKDGSDAPCRRGDADWSDQRGPGQDYQRPVRNPDSLCRARSRGCGARGRSLLAASALRGIQRSVAKRNRRHAEHRRSKWRARSPRPCSCRNSQVACPGSTWISQGRRGPRRASRSCQRDRRA